MFLSAPKYLQIRSSVLAASGVALSLLLIFPSPATAEISPERLAKKRTKAMANGKILGPEGERQCLEGRICEYRYHFGQTSEAYDCSQYGTGTTEYVESQSARDRKEQLYTESAEAQQKAAEVKQSMGSQNLPWAAERAETVNAYQQKADDKKSEADDYFVPSYPVYTPPPVMCRYRNWDVDFVKKAGRTKIVVQQDIDSENLVVNQGGTCSLSLRFLNRLSTLEQPITLPCSRNEGARTLEATVPPQVLEDVKRSDKFVSISIDNGGHQNAITTRRTGSRYRYTLADFTASQP